MYNPALPAHGPDHPATIAANVLLEVEYCEEHDLMLTQAQIIQLLRAAWGHDPKKDKPVPSGFDNHEAWASRITYEELTRDGVDEDEALKSASLIPATSPVGPCRSIGQKILRRADVRNVRDDYDFFDATTHDHYDEYVMPKECDIDGPGKLDLPQWFDEIACGRYLVPLLLVPDLTYGDFDRGLSGKAVGQEISFTQIQRQRRSLGLELFPKDFLG